MRVSIFDCHADGRLVFRAEDSLDVIMPERDDTYEEALEALDAAGFAHVGGGAAPEVLLVRTATDADRERRVLRRQIALRVLRAVRPVRAAAGLPPIDARAMMMALAQAEDMGCRLRLRDLAAADEADVVHDVIGIVTHQLPASGAVDLTAFRPRFLESDEAAGPATCKDRLQVHRGRLSLEAIAAGAAPPWHLDETDTATDRSIVIRDADNGYVCEIDLREFRSPTDDGVEQARSIGRLICAAVVAQVPCEALAADMAELAEGSTVAAAVEAGR